MAKKYRIVRINEFGMFFSDNYDSLSKARNAQHKEIEGYKNCHYGRYSSTSLDFEFNKSGLGVIVKVVNNNFERKEIKRVFLGIEEV